MCNFLNFTLCLPLMTDEYLVYEMSGLCPNPLHLSYQKPVLNLLKTYFQPGLLTSLE